MKINVNVVISLKENAKNPKVHYILAAYRIPVNEDGKLNRKRIKILGAGKFVFKYKIGEWLYFIIRLQWQDAENGREHRAYILTRVEDGVNSRAILSGYGEVSVKNLNILHAAVIHFDEYGDEYYDKQTQELINEIKKNGFSVKTIWDVFAHITAKKYAWLPSAFRVRKVSLWIVSYQLPSHAVLEQIIPSYYKGTQIGRKIIALLRGPPLNALKNYRRKFAEIINQYAIHVGPFSFVDAKGLTEIERVFEDLLKDYEELEQNINNLLEAASKLENYYQTKDPVEQAKIVKEAMSLVPEKWRHRYNIETLKELYALLDDAKTKLFAEMEQTVRHIIEEIRKLYGVRTNDKKIAQKMLQLYRIFAALQYRFHSQYLTDFCDMIPTSSAGVNENWDNIPYLLEDALTLLRRVQKEHKGIRTFLKEINIKNRAALWFIPLNIDMTDVLSNTEKEHLRELIKESVMSLQHQLNKVIDELYEYLNNAKRPKQKLLEKAAQLDNMANIAKGLQLTEEQKRIALFRDLIAGMAYNDKDLIETSLQELDDTDKQFASAIKGLVKLTEKTIEEEETLDDETSS